MEFRLLRADEIDCRISIVNKWGVGLLLYKDARCDQNILDETVGVLNWQRHHTRDNANCIVSIWDESKQQWIEKEDTGTESFTEKEKGLASDSFKRACFNFGIGRELYTAPNMFFPANKLKKLEPKGTGFTCRDMFKVSSIEYDGRTISSVVIDDITSGERVKFGNAAARTTDQPRREPAQPERETIGMEKAMDLSNKCREAGVKQDTIVELYKVKSFKDLTNRQLLNINEHWNEIVAKYGTQPGLEGFEPIPDGVQTELPFV